MNIVSHHYGRDKIPRVLLASPSAKNRVLGKENLPRVLHSGKNCTRGREAFPSAVEILALGKEKHSVKALFPKCNTQGRSTLGKETCYLTVHPAHAVKTLKTKILPRVPSLALGEEALSRVPGQGTRGRGCLPRVPCPGTRERDSSPSAREGTRGRIFVFFVFFCLIFLRPSHII